MPVTQVKCPSCQTLLKLNAVPAAGAAIRCPKCSKPFRLAGVPKQPAAPPPAKAAAPAPPPARPSKPAPPAAAPRPKPKPPRDEDEDEPRRAPERRPARKRDEDEDDDRPAKLAKKSGRGKGLVLVLLVLFLLCGGVAGAGYWAFTALNGGLSNALAQATGKPGPPDAPAPENKAPPEKQPPQGESADVDPNLRFVAPDFFAGAVINVPAVFKSPVVEGVLPNEVQDPLMKEMNFDVRTVERIILLGEAWSDPDFPVAPAVIIRFREPVDGAAFLHKVIQDVGEKSFEGKTYRVARPERGREAAPPFAGYVADEKTVLWAPEPILKKMLTARGDGPLAVKMKGFDPSAEASAAFLMEPVKPVAGDLLKKLKEEMPPDMADVGTLPERLKGATLALTLAGDTLLTLALDGSDDESAAVIEKLLTHFHGLAKEEYPHVRESIAGELKGFREPMPADLLKEILAVIDQVPEGIQVARSGSRVTVALKSPAGLGAVAPKVGTFAKQLARPRKEVAKPAPPLPPVPNPATPEDPEFVAYAKKKGWGYSDRYTGIDNKPVGYLGIDGGAALTPEDCAMIARSKNVRVLELRNAKITDDGLKVVALPQLEQVSVGGDDVTDAGLSALVRCQSLHSVILTTKKTTDAGVKELAKLPKLRWLHLGFTTLSGSAFEAFAGSKTLEHLTLEYVDGLTDDGVKHLAGVPNLIELKIGKGFEKSSLTAAAIKAIVDVRVPARFEFDMRLLDDDLFESLVKKGWLYGPTPPGLRGYEKPATPEKVRVIMLDDSKVTDKGMRAVLNCTNVESLHLQNTGVTDETFKQLSGFKKLDYLSLESTKITAAGLDAIAGLPIKHIGLQGIELTEDAFKALGKMTSLEVLWLSRAKMKAEWLKHVAALPKLRDLNLLGADFDDAAAKYVVTMPGLKSLTLNDTKLGDAGFTELLKAPQLESLYMDGTKVTKEVYQKAKKDHPKLRLYYYAYDR
ncbi:MAG TPA: hypothetical protein VFW33_12735 [Gemmataceae bacterium]|nr:hypothetical protein [Gemmataceae bacterium]